MAATIHKEGGIVPPRLVKLGDSQTVEVGDFVEVYQNGVATLATAAQPILGAIKSICDSKGLPISTATRAAGSVDVSGITSVATSTGGTYYAWVEQDEETVYSVPVSGTLGTTTSSNLEGGKIDVDSANTEYGQLLETTHTRTISTPANFYSLGVDPKNSSNLLVKVAMSERRSVLE